MSRTMMLSVIAALAVGCEPESGIRWNSPVGSGLHDDSVVGEEDESTEPTNPLVADWVISSTEKELASELVVEIKNLSAQDFVASAQLISRGLIRKVETLDLGAVDLPAGESAMISVAAADLPVQTTTGFIQARFELSFGKEGAEATRRIVFPPVYFQHGPGYEGILIVDEAALVNGDQGKLAGAPAGVSEAGAVIGRVSDALGGFSNVTIMSDEFESATGGHVAGWETGTEISVGSDGSGEEVAE